jgi:hypothetical protein
MLLRTWKESMSNSFQEPASWPQNLTSRSVTQWNPFHPDSLGKTKDKDIAKALCRGAATLRVPGYAETDTVKCVGFMAANKVLQVVSTQRGPSYLIPFLQTRGIERGLDMRTLVKINFPTARTLQELEEDLSIECTSSASEWHNTDSVGLGALFIFGNAEWNWKACMRTTQTSRH